MSETNKTLNPASFRITDEIKEKFRDLSKEFGMNQDDTLRKLISIHEIDQAKIQIVGRRTEIETFETHLNALSEVYRASLQLNQDAEERIKLGYITTLESNQKTIIGLQEQKEKNDIIIEKNKEQIEDLTEQLNKSLRDYTTLVSEMTKTEQLCEEYKGKNDMLNGLLTEYDEDRKQQKELKKQFEEITRENKELNVAAKQMELLKQQSEEKIEQLKEKHKGDLSLLEKESESSLRMAVLETKEEYSRQIEELNNKSNGEYRALLDELEMLRQANNQLEKSLLQKPISSTRKKKNEVVNSEE